MKAHLRILLDRSGSMATIRQDMEKGFDSFIQEQRNVSGELSVTLIQFDSENSYEVIYKNTDIQKVAPLTLTPRAGTPLLDAMGKLIIDLENDIKFSTIKPDQVYVVIISDGQENMSKEFSRSQIRQLVLSGQNQGWQFIYLGANQDAIQEASSIGVNAHSTITYASNPAGVKNTYDVLSNNMATSRTSGQEIKFSEEDREKATE